MCNFNNGRFIGEAIESVIGQSENAWELIVVDDGSSDNSFEVINSFLHNEKIRLHCHKESLGYGAASRTGVDLSRGEIIGFIDSDDALAKEAIAIMLKAHINNPECGLIYSTHYICDEHLKIIDVAKWVGSPGAGSTNLHEPKASAFRTFKRKFYDLTSGFNSRLTSAVDKDIIYKLEEVAPTKFINKPLYYRRMNRNGISQFENSQTAYLNSLRVQFKAFLRRKKRNIINIRRQDLSCRLLTAFPDSIKNKEPDSFRFFLWQGFVLWPFNFRCQLRMLRKILSFL